MNVVLAILAFAGPPIGAALAWWLNSKSEQRQREWAVADREADHERSQTLWLRDHRRQAYADLYAAQQAVMNAGIEAAKPLRPEMKLELSQRALAAMMTLNGATAAAMLLATEPVRETAEMLRVGTVSAAGALVVGQDITDEQNDALNELRVAFIDRAQAEILGDEVPPV